MKAKLKKLHSRSEGRIKEFPQETENYNVVLERQLYHLELLQNSTANYTKTTVKEFERKIKEVQKELEKLAKLSLILNAEIKEDSELKSDLKKSKVSLNKKRYVKINYLGYSRS